MENILDKRDPRELGKELQNARKTRGFTQEDAAKLIGVARTTITAIEKGERRIKADELISLARAYGRQISDFVRSRPVLEPFQVQFRGPTTRSEEDEAQIRPCIDKLEELARNYLELERLMQAPLVRKYPQEYNISGLKTEQASESVALKERIRLDLGDGPISILRSILEQDVGLRIFYLPLTPSKFSAMYIYNEQLGGCIGINSQHPEERRRWSLAHDYGHFLAHRYRASFYVEDAYQRVPETERFADYFALHFLMPTGGITRRFTDIRRDKQKVTAADLCTMANYYGVSMAAITRRLEDLRLLPTGTWNKIKESGFKVREAQQQLGIKPIPAQAEKLPMRYQYLAIEAFDEGKISEGLLAQFLQVDRLEARRIAEVVRTENCDLMDASEESNVSA